jgi:ATPase subunit of ABC transporter with duplicated ATPase domains
MLTLTRLAKSYGARTLFSDVSLQLNAGCRYGLIGANGSGKTTLLRVLAGDEPASEGSFVVPGRARIGVLRQDQFLDDAQPILSVAMMGDGPVWRALVERDAIVERGEGDPSRLADLEHIISMDGGYTLEARATAVLVGLGIPQGVHRQALGTLSGGFKLRVLLSQVLLGGPDLLLLDEPTNHLDILSIRWLEKFLAGHRGLAIVISHDQRFLDNVATHILDVDYETVTAYVGNYSKFAIEKATIRARKEAEIARAEEVIAEKRAFVERFGAKATKAKQAQSRLKQIEKIEVEELASSSRRAPLFRFTQVRPSGRDVLELGGLSKSYGEKRVLTDVSLSIRRGEKLAIIGPNGLGKSTLLKAIMGVVPLDSGTVRWGHETHPGYFAQDHHELLPNEVMTPLEYLWEVCPTEGQSYVRGQLGRVLFSGDDVTKPIGALSGGEAARLIFGKIIVERPNVLVLDEPTNHLDLEAIAALVEGLKAFEGTVLLVSHDRWFVSQLATRVLELTESGPRAFPGTYDEYLQRCGDDHLDADTVVKRAKQEARDARTDAADAKSSRQAWEEQKRRRNRLAALPARRDKVLASIEQAEARRAVIAAYYAEPGFFQRTTKNEVEALERESQSLQTQIEAWMAEWEALETELAAQAP